MSATPKKAIRLSAVLLAGSLLAGCAGYSKHHFEVSKDRHGYKQRHPITIGEKEQTLDIPVGSSTPELPRPAKEAIAGFAQEYSRNPSGAMRVMMPTGSHNASVASALGADILEALSDGGVAASNVEIMHYDASRHGPTAPIRLSYHGITASVHECGRWDADLGRQPDNGNYSNFGCASQKNLAAIVANPADLLAPRGTTPVDGANRAQKIEKYRQGSPTKSSNDISISGDTFGG